MAIEEDLILYLKGVIQRAEARPCSRLALDGLKTELNQRVVEFRQQREIQRLRNFIETESVEMRKALGNARAALTRALVEHDRARMDVVAVEDLVRRGRLGEAVKASSNLYTHQIFPDLNCDFVNLAVDRRQTRELWLIAGIVATTGIVLIGITVVELIRRATPPAL